MSLIPLAVLLGCGSVAYRPVDLEIDVIGAVPAEAETIHMCVEGSGELSEGAGNGRVLFAGLHTDHTATITLAFFTDTGEVIGGAGPIDLDEATPWAEVEQDDRADDCVAEGTTTTADEASWVLGTRFTGETW